jgi:cysteine desulfurase
MRSIYLDYSTTTPVAASVRDKMLPFLSEFYGHPASCHWYGRAAQEAVEDARSSVGTLLGCHPTEIAFTSGGTESVNLGLLGAARAIRRAEAEPRPHLITSTLDHAAVTCCADQLEREGWSVSLVGCDRSGVISMDEFEAALRDSTRLVSIIHASHRVGTIQPIEQLSAICNERNIVLHTDAAQSVGKIACDVETLGVDLLSFSGHKMYGPKGVGGLYVRTGVAVDPILYGESHESGLRAGTCNVAAIAGLGQAARLAELGLASAIDRVSSMRDRFYRQLETAIGKPIRVLGQGAKRVPGILSIELPGVTAEAIQQKTPELCLGPAYRSGDGKPDTEEHRKAPQQFGPTELQSPETLRISFGWTTSEDELQQAVHLLAAAYESLTA